MLTYRAIAEDIAQEFTVDEIILILKAARMTLTDEGKWEYFVEVMGLDEDYATTVRKKFHKFMVRALDCDYCVELGVNPDIRGIARYEVELLDRGSSPGEGLLGYADDDTAYICEECLRTLFDVEPSALPHDVYEEDGRHIRINP